MFALYGAGGHCKVVIDILKSWAKNTSNTYGDTYVLEIKIFDDERKSKYLLERWPVVIPRHGVSIEKQVPETCRFIVTIGDNKTRKQVVERLALKDDMYWRCAKHPNSTVSGDASVGFGTVVMAGAVINAGAKIGKHCIINSGAVVEHDCVLGDYVHISPNASLAGGVVVGEGTHVGIGACVIPKVKIGAWSVVGAGAVIIRDVPDNATVVGNPGRVIKLDGRPIVKQTNDQVEQLRDKVENLEDETRRIMNIITQEDNPGW